MDNYTNTYSLFEYQGVHHISDDVPIFPTGEGWKNALINLTSYPIGTKLYEIETIGVIVTFLTNKKIEDDKSEIWDEKHLHTAIYVDDFIELFNLGYVKGIKPITEFKYDLNQFNRLLKSGCTLNSEGNIELYMEPTNGKIKKHIIVKPQIEKYVCEYIGEDWDESYRNELIDEYETDNKPFIEILDNIEITEKGFEKYVELSQEFEIPQRIKELVTPLIRIEYYSSAIREVSVLFETMLKKFHNTDLMGWKLIDLHIKQCIKANDGNYNAGIKVYRQELRLVNSFIRNKFMHNVINVNKENFYSILFRQCNLFRLMEQAFNKLLEA